MIKLVAAAVSLSVSGLLGLGVASPAGTAVAAEPDLPSHTSIVVAAKRALDYYRPTYATTTLTPRNGWSWGTYFQGVHEVYRHAGDARYQADGMAWGRSNAWQLNTVETNPDTIKAGEVYHRLHETDPTASLDAMDAKMSADLTGLPLSRYDWIDALFMGLPNWALWSARTGSPAYLDKLDALFRWTRDQGATGSRCGGRVPPQSGLYDASAGLWYRDCRFVGAKDVNGLPVFWSRGNGWVIAAMADVLQSLPAGDPRAATYAGMLRTMAASLAPLQGADGSACRLADLSTTLSSTPQRFFSDVRNRNPADPLVRPVSTCSAARHCPSAIQRFRGCDRLARGSRSRRSSGFRLQGLCPLDGSRGRSSGTGPGGPG